MWGGADAVEEAGLEGGGRLGGGLGEGEFGGGVGVRAEGGEGGGVGGAEEVLEGVLIGGLEEAEDVEGGEFLEVVVMGLAEGVH